MILLFSVGWPDENCSIIGSLASSQQFGEIPFYIWTKGRRRVKTKLYAYRYNTASLTIGRFLEPLINWLC